MKLNKRVVTSLKREEAICDLAIEHLLASIRHYEEKHGMSTQDFLSKFESGEAGDDEDSFKWFSLAEAVEDWRQTKKELREVVG